MILVKYDKYEESRDNLFKTIHKHSRGQNKYDLLELCASCAFETLTHNINKHIAEAARMCVIAEQELRKAEATA